MPQRTPSPRVPRIGKILERYRCTDSTRDGPSKKKREDCVPLARYSTRQDWIARYTVTTAAGMRHKKTLALSRAAPQVRKKAEALGRPRHNHSKMATNPLKEWFGNNLRHPFPRDQDKAALAETTGNPRGFCLACGFSCACSYPTLES